MTYHEDGEITAFFDLVLSLLLSFQTPTLQGLVWEYLKDSCGKLLPQLHEPFGCCFDGRGTTFVGKVESLPHLPTLLLMKASGLSLLTLGPVLLMCINMGRKASACEIPVEGEVEERYAVLREDVDGI